jgi:hypothetical protein
MRARCWRRVLRMHRLQLLHHPGAQPRVLVIGNGAGILQSFELFDFICHAVADHLAKFVASLLSPFTLPLRHPAVLRDQVDENA